MKKIILLLFLGFTGTLNAQTIELNVTPAKSEKNKWCIAATTKCVLGYKGTSKSQCNIMEYIRANSTEHGDYNCCLTINENDPDWHPCNKGVVLGYNKEKASAKGILWHFGTIPSIAFKGNHPNTDYIRNWLTLQCPLIIHVEYYNNIPIEDHALVICGIKGNQIDGYEIKIMDPMSNALEWEPYDNLKDNGGRKWVGTLAVQSCTRGYPCHCYNLERDGDEADVDCGGSCPPCPYPDHCYNKKLDADKGEIGIDCGGPCPKCPYPDHCYNGVQDSLLLETGIDCGGPCPVCPPPPPTCDDCIHNQFEHQIDCGAPNCPPCKDLPEEISINGTPFGNPNGPLGLNGDYMATEKITTSGRIAILAANVNFFTEEDGTIILNPGFVTYQPCTFTAQSKDLSEYGRACPEKFCENEWFNTKINCPPSGSKLVLYDLLYAKKIVYKIYDVQQRFIYGNEINIT